MSETIQRDPADLARVIRIIVTRTQNDAILDSAFDTMRAIRVKSPMVLRRYERLLAAVLDDETCEWTPREREGLVSFWTKSARIDLNDDEAPVARIVHITPADWARARVLGDGKHEIGISVALREAMQRDV